MARRKVHLGDEIWEWQVGGRCWHYEDKYVIVRAPSGVVTQVRNTDLFGSCSMDVATPGRVKEYIERNKEMLAARPEKHKGKTK
jgi:hypothetical protein